MVAVQKKRTLNKFSKMFKQRIHNGMNRSNIKPSQLEHHI